MLVRRTPEEIRTPERGVGRESLALSNRTGLIPEKFSHQLFEMMMPVKKNLSKYFEKLKSLGLTQEISVGLQLLRNNKEKIVKAIKSLKAMEAQEGIASIGISGFEHIIDLNLEGIQLNISSGENKVIFDDIIRRYIFKYTGDEWPPSLDSFTYFIRDSPDRQMCCFYWPLYAYIKTLFFSGFRGRMDLGDLFSLDKIQRYCDDPFKTKGQPNGQQFQKGQKNSRRQFGGEGPNDRRPERPQDQRGFRNRNPRQQFQSQKQQFQPRPNLTASFARQCDPNKLRLVKQTLQRNTIIWMVNNKEYPITEWLALNQIVTQYVRNLPDEELIANNQSVEGFVESSVDEDLTRYEEDDPRIANARTDEEREELVYRDYQGRINDNITVIIDPIMEVPYTYRELKAWFGVKAKGKPKFEQSRQRGGNKKSGKKFDKKKQGFTAIPYRNPVTNIKYILKQFREHYSLPSPMFMMDERTLEGVRRRLLKTLLVIFLQLEEIYDEVLTSKMSSMNPGSSTNVDERATLVERVKNMMARLNNAISQETDPVKREKLLRLKEVAKAKFGTLVREFGVD